MYIYIYIYIYICRYESFNISVNKIQVTPLGCFTHISITTPIVPALKTYYI
jgi:hypothetical protein